MFNKFFHFGRKVLALFRFLKVNNEQKKIFNFFPKLASISTLRFYRSTDACLIFFFNFFVFLNFWRNFSLFKVNNIIKFHNKKIFQNRLLSAKDFGSKTFLISLEKKSKKKNFSQKLASISTLRFYRSTNPCLNFFQFFCVF